MDNSEEIERQKKPKMWPKGERDHPEQYPTEKESLFDMWESEQNVDPIPMEDLKLEQREQKRKEETKHKSSSEEKYKQ
jgi:hypothetical protein